MRISTAVLALAACTALAGCSSSAEKRELAQQCPNAYRVQEATSLVRFKPGPGRDPIDVVFRAELGTLDVTCTFNARRQYVDVDLKVQLLVAQGPVSGIDRANFEYAVGVIGPTGTPLQRQRFGTDVAFSANRGRGTVTDEVTIRLPFTSQIDPAAYRIAIGIVLTAEELDYNRRAAGAAPQKQ